MSVQVQCLYISVCQVAYREDRARDQATDCSFFFHGPPPPKIYTLSLHDALPISISTMPFRGFASATSATIAATSSAAMGWKDRKSTRLNSSHANISYAVFCLKKKKTITLPFLQ